MGAALRNFTHFGRNRRRHGAHRLQENIGLKVVDIRRIAGHHHYSHRLADSSADSQHNRRHCRF